MTTLNVTELFSEIAPYYCANSIHNLGPDAGRVTWSNCLTLADSDAALAADWDYEAVREHIAQYGAWDSEEIAAMGEADLRAFVIQEVASDLRALGSDYPHEFMDTDVSDDALCDTHAKHYLYRTGESIMCDLIIGV